MESALRSTLPLGRFGSVDEARSRIMRAVRARGNRSTERRLRMALVRAGISGWILHAVSIPGCPDFLFESKKLAVFVDGCFWHGCPRCGHLPKANGAFWKKKITLTRMRDKKVNQILRSGGYTVLRFWEHDLSMELDLCLKRIRRALDGEQRGQERRR